MLKEEVEKILAGKRDFNNLNDICGFIYKKGNEFRKRLTHLQEEIQTYPGCESFCFRTTDYRGRRYIAFGYPKSVRK